MRVNWPREVASPLCLLFSFGLLIKQPIACVCVDRSNLRELEARHVPRCGGSALGVLRIQGSLRDKSASYMCDPSSNLCHQPTVGVVCTCSFG